MASPSTPLFVCYSREDAAWLQRLHVHLKPLTRTHAVAIWDDTRIVPGMDWRREIREALSSARVAVLLVSADFLASDFIDQSELPGLLHRAAIGGTHILPVIVTPCLYLQHEQLARFQSVNPPTRPLTAMAPHEADETLVKLAQTILTLLRAPPPAAHAPTTAAHAAPWKDGGTRDSAPAGEPVDRASPAAAAEADKATIRTLWSQLEQLAVVATQLLRRDNPLPDPVIRDAEQLAELARIEGAWIDDDNGQRLYARIVKGRLHVPYSIMGNNELTGACHGFAKVGPVWFSRFSWVRGGWRGCALHRQVSPDRLEVTWWGVRDSDVSIPLSGIRLVWRRAPAEPFPEWAERYFASIEHGPAAAQPDPAAAQKDVPPQATDRTDARATPEDRPKGGSGRRVDREDFLEACSPAAAAFFASLLDEAARRGDQVYWGTTGFSLRVLLDDGAERGSYAYGYPPDDFRFYFQDGAPWSRKAEAAAFRRELLSTGLFRESGRLTLTARITESTTRRLQDVARRIFERVDESCAQSSKPA